MQFCRKKQETFYENNYLHLKCMLVSMILRRCFSSPWHCNKRWI